MRDIHDRLLRFRARTPPAILAIVCALCISSLLLAQEGGRLPAVVSQNEGMPVSPSVRPPQAAPSNSAAPAPASSQSSSSSIAAETPSVPVDQIIQQFAAHEAEFKTERDNFTYTQTFTIQTLDDAARPDGEYTMTSDITFTPDGKRYENVTYAPAPTLERITLSPQDFADLENVQPFVLTAVDLPKYNVTYVGRQAVDALGTYVFDVAPKTLEKNQRYFQGRIWVDDRDLEIVKTDGKAVPDIRKGGNENVFPRFETYRENIEGHYWFPTYTRSDDFLHFKTGDVHIHMSVRYTNYKRFRVSIRLLPVPSDKK